MSDTDNTGKPRSNWRNAEEPWPIWAAVLVFLNIVVIATMNFGLPGLVASVIPAAGVCIIIMLMIATGR